MLEKIKCRLANIKDIDEIVNINRICLPENYPIDYFLYHLRDFQDLFIVATIFDNESEKVIGYSMNRVEYGFSNFGFSIVKKGHVISFAVLPQYRRKGVGSYMMQETISRFIKRNVSEIYLEVRVSNEPAINLYKKFNFKIVSRIKGYYSDNEDAYVMALKLA